MVYMLTLLTLRYKMENKKELELEIAKSKNSLKGNVILGTISSIALLAGLSGVSYMFGMTNFAIGTFLGICSSVVCVRITREYASVSKKGIQEKEQKFNNLQIAEMSKSYSTNKSPTLNTVFASSIEKSTECDEITK